MRARLDYDTAVAWCQAGDTRSVVSWLEGDTQDTQDTKDDVDNMDNVGNGKSGDTRLLLHCAATTGSRAVLEVLLEREVVEVDVREEGTGDTALHMAAR